MTRRLSKVRVYWASILLLLSTPAHAQSQAPSTLSRNADAVAEGRAALEAYEQGHWEIAYRRFAQAEALAHSPVFVLHMARAKRRLGAGLEAQELYDRVLQDTLSASAPESWRLAQESARAERAGLAALPATEAPSEPQRDAPAPPTPEQVAPRAPEQSTQPTTSGVTQPEPQRPTARNRTAAYVIGGVGFAGLLTGVVAGALAWNSLHELEQDCDGTRCDPRDAHRLDSVHRFGTVADISFATGAAALGTAAILLWVVPEPPSANQPLNGLTVVARARF
jgi:hypothetical protein